MYGEREREREIKVVPLPKSPHLALGSLQFVDFEPRGRLVYLGVSWLAKHDLSSVSSYLENGVI